MNAKELSAAWAVDQCDPDNWIKIPEFGVNPQDVAFEDFAYPIVTPIAKGYGLRCIVRELVKTARTLIRKDGGNLSAVRANYIEVLDMMEATPKNKKFDVSSTQGMATFYTVVMQSAERAISPLISLEGSYESISHCAEAMRSLTLLALKGKTEALDTAASEALTRHISSQRRKLSEAGKIGAEEKNKATKALKDWALTEAVNMHGSDKDKSQILSARRPKHLADVSKDPERLIYDALRKQKAELIRKASHP